MRPGADRVHLRPAAARAGGGRRRPGPAAHRPALHPLRRPGVGVAPADEPGLADAARRLRRARRRATGRARATPPTGPGALADGDPSTTWVASSSRPRILLRCRTAPRCRGCGSTSTRERRPRCRSGSCCGPGDRHRVVDVDANGRARLPHWRVRDLAVRVESTYPAFTPDGPQFAELGPGISELRINGHSLTSSVFTTLTIPCGQGPGSTSGARSSTPRSPRTRAACCGAPRSRSRCASPTGPRRA